MSQEEHLINGELLRLRREAQGWVVGDLALRACLSVKQVRQLEEGGTSAFYSPSVKVTAAKKVGGLLGLSAAEVFISTSAPTPASIEQHVEEYSEPIAQPVQVEPPIAAAPSVVAELATASVEVQASEASPSAHVQQEQTKPKTSLWLIVGLFAAALGVAAYMQPKEETVTEAAPPLQVVPTETDPAASASDAASASASAAASDAVSATVQKSASAPTLQASIAATSVAPAVRTPASVASSAAPSAAPASKAP